MYVGGLRLCARTFWVLLAIFAAVRVAAFFSYPLIDGSESRYGRIALQMARSGDWIVPHLNDQTPFLGKPPLTFWMAAGAFRVFGQSDFVARLTPLFAAAVAAWLVYLGGKSAGGSKTRNA